jgi:hypothetical protein
MASPKLGARSLAMSALAWLAPLSLAAGCYSTVPHRAQVATMGSARSCSDAVADVFARSGFVQLPTPPHLSMFFAPRIEGPYSSFLRTGAGVGVTLQQHGESPACAVTLEALSPDAACPDATVTINCGGTGSFVQNQESLPLSPPLYGPLGRQPQVCPVVPPLSCQLSYAPGADNDAAVDELARRVQVALGPAATVN